MLLAPLLGLLPCPPTRWDALGELTPAAPRDFLAVVTAPPSLSPTAEREWLERNREWLMDELGEHGALHFKGFRLPATSAGLRDFCSALPLVPCADPLASVGVRSLLSAPDGVYEAVNAESLSKTFIGLHNDVTYKLAAPFAAFACFQPAKLGGGDFLLADGRAVLATLPAGVLATLRERLLSVRVPLDLAVAFSADERTLQILEQPKAPAVDEAVGRHVVRVPMATGEVVLLDSYQALHGRDCFEGRREHGVVWLDEERGERLTCAALSSKSCVRQIV
ncbi:hypothetical protein EMIHUDRAFT_222557 [Emiliania huxleyi CCMP1516]|uniref:TauD/TfdA-like domain-containing protein n=2 Tax=Emiliania huxleyi TaxID=2903 RepID=A0A0D3KXJ6_EMIH1|nr:hypothetical protein EMIHUDRAFT_219707 [Emiliania huxleyi CCMP1516]XP_005792910.1 hypothetical protein EMIHUDRAFT_222557 [Emiliania huxleyi CCMP1516]EOD05973.1 hypothetical protein EMIHUDRAFT_219707 [Emiliania huxleyi CCMP1516]EOD40481.1 hypothetical protein EMIHUDRAFT_222557 [Emiliania huxleyi CCMP1516]|eukprot:XP_005758402.1 hypothetical protein EMIHUDRAFT_219707 [Emiliania huxleyi CCMP1516]